jgi:hypothetical protein
VGEIVFGALRYARIITLPRGQRKHHLLRTVLCHLPNAVESSELRIKSDWRISLTEGKTI